MRLKIFSLQNTFLLAALLCLSTSIKLSPSPSLNATQRGSLAKITVPAILSFGHREFAWLLRGLGGLSAAFNAWEIATNPNTQADKAALVRQRLRDFSENLPEFAREQLGMREIFIFPATYFAFSTSEIDTALEIAEQGVTDPKIRVDLMLTVAYLTHLFKNDLQAAADAYQRLLELFPQSTWLNKTILKLRSGVDPFLEDVAERPKNCVRLLSLFPFSKQKLIERGICQADTKNKSGKP